MKLILSILGVVRGVVIFINVVLTLFFALGMMALFVLAVMANEPFPFHLFLQPTYLLAFIGWVMLLVIPSLITALARKLHA